MLGLMVVITVLLKWGWGGVDSGGAEVVVVIAVLHPLHPPYPFSTPHPPFAVPPTWQATSSAARQLRARSRASSTRCSPAACAPTCLAARSRGSRGGGSGCWRGAAQASRCTVQAAAFPAHAFPVALLVPPLRPPLHAALHEHPVPPSIVYPVLHQHLSLSALSPLYSLI